MIKLKYSTFKDPSFTHSLMKLMRHDHYKSTRISYNIAKLGRKYEMEAKICQELFQKLVKQYAKTDEKGGILPILEGEKTVPNTYQIKDEHLDEWKKKMDDFDNTEVEIPVNRIKLEDLDGVPLSPADMGALEAVICELEVV